MNRRESLKLLGSAALAASLPSAALSRGTSLVLIYDGRFEAARRLARDVPRAFDCQSDAAALWYGHFAGRADQRFVLGLTTPADAMVLADCARREVLTFAAWPVSAPAAQLVHWTIEPKGLP